MPLKELFTSNARVKVLKYFFNNPEEEQYIRELTRILDEQINSIRRELTNLRKIGLLKTRSRARKKYYYLDPQFIFYNELKSIFTKANNNNDDFVRKLVQLGKLRLVVLTGFFIGKEGTVDLLLVGEVDKDAVAQLLETEMQSEKPIRFSHLAADDFVYRLKCNDRFIVDIITNDENIIAHNTFDNQLLQKKR